MKTMSNRNPQALVPGLLCVRKMALVTATLLVFVAGCGDDDDEPRQLPEYEFPLNVEASDRDDNPIPGLPVLLDGETIGFTDADGNFEATLLERPRETIRLAVDHTDSHRVLDDEPFVEQTLQITESLHGDYRGVPVYLRVDVEPVLHQHLLWVQIDCDDDLDDEFCTGLPVLVDGVEVAETDRLGHAHAVLESRPGNTHEVSIATPEHDDEDDDSPKFAPADPVFEFEFEPDASIYHVEQEFTDDSEDDQPVVRRRPTRRSSSSGSSGSSSSSEDDTTDATPEPQQEEEDDCSGGGVIDLDCL